MTKQISKKPPSQTDVSMADPRDSAALIRQLQDKLLALGEDVDTLAPADIEKTAKAISTLIGSVEKADAYLQASGAVKPSDGLSEPSRLDLLRKIKRMVDNGVLNELADDADV
ncbi:hypothetical protein GCM10009069_22660 [Algimonas arctica]|uniref:Uncharacterized protein n=1 Tax=Algimonas arctica TaxID=1479486 RepID=A0A8J3CSH9_9PROT|nr:hypothetical protein [Algimonas arctica]GHA99140.1 hypothetical protein GCM10009069_22660 [Algimonas arctica]